MKQAITLILGAALAALMMVGTVSAAPLNAAIRDAASQVRLSAGALHQKYVEDDSYGLVPTSYLDKETGNIPAFGFDYGIVSPSGVYSKLHFLYAVGDTDYDGYLQSGSTFTPYATTTSNKLFDARGNLGYFFGLGTRVGIAPEIELGYTRWKREIQGQYGSDQTYDSYRYGLGLEVDVAATDRLVFIFEGVTGRQHSRVNSSLLNESLGTNGYYRLTGGVDYRLTERVHLGFSATRVHSKASESSVSSAGYLEPESQTDRTRFMASVGWTL